MSSQLQQKLAGIVRLRNSGQGAQALQEARQLVIQNPENFDANFFEGILLADEKQYAEAAAPLQKCIHLNPAHKHLYTTLALCLFRSGDFDYCTRVLRQGGEKFPEYAYAKNVLLGDAYEKAVEKGKELRQTNPIATEGTWPSVANAGLCVFASCDSVYFAKYAEGLIRSFGEKTSDTSLHIHLFGPTQECRNIYENLCGETADSRVTMTTSTAGLGTRAYYASARFLVFESLLKRLDCPVYSLDFDSMFRRDVGGLVVLPGDVCVRPRRNELAFEKQVAIGGLLVRPTAGGRAFLDLFAAYLAYCLFEVGPQWFLDQIAFIAVQTHCESGGLDVAFGELPHVYLDFEGDPDAAIVTKKG